MPLHVEIFHSRRFVHVVADGPVTLKEMEAHFDQLVVDRKSTRLNSSHT